MSNYGLIATPSGTGREVMNNSRKPLFAGNINHSNGIAADAAAAAIERSSAISDTRRGVGNRQLQGQALVILARTGERVQRSYSQFSLGFESFLFRNDDIIPVSSAASSENTLLIGNNSIRSRLVSSFEKWKRKTVKRLTNDEFHQVLKCAIAYSIASLAVYWGSFDKILGNSDSKHLVATVAVYFHPLRSSGSMIQSLTYAVVLMLFTCFVTFGCLSLSGYFFRIGEDEICYTIDLLVCLVALGFIAFMKQKVNKPTFNTACLLASISIVACIIKEGSLNASKIPVGRIVLTLTCVAVGCFISVVCCFVIWPVRAVVQLRKHLNDLFNILSALLLITANRFLNGENLLAKDIEWFNQLNNNITQLNKDLEEAAYELTLKGRRAEYKVFVELVSTTKSLARHIQAIRSSVEIQWSLLHENKIDDENQSVTSRNSSLDENFPFHLSQLVENMTKVPLSIPLKHGNSAITSLQLFDLFVYYLAPLIKLFIFTMKGILQEVPFENYNEESKEFAPTEPFQRSLGKAELLYSEKQSESFAKLYSQEAFTDVDILLKADQEEVTACCGNFSSLLGEFSRELMKFLKLSEKYQDARDSLLLWRFNEIRPINTIVVEEDLNDALDNFRLQYESTVSIEYENEQEQQDIVERRRKEFSYVIWQTLNVFKRTDVQFGFRVGLGALFLSIFAFTSRTKDLFEEWRGEWALAIYCIMMNKSVGGTTMTVKWRILGTFVGCFGAYFLWWLTDGNVYALFLGGFCLAIPSFEIIMFWKANNPFGRFILLAYNLTALYSYSMTQKDTEDGREGGDDPIIGDIAFHRFISVSVGIIWALTMTNLFLPNSARKRLKRGLTILWLRMGVIWNSDPLDYEQGKLTGLKDQKGLHDLLEECKTLLKQAPLEFRLKGAFPTTRYQLLLSSTSKILDAFLNMNLMIQSDSNLSNNEKYVLEFISDERKEVEHRIFLIFYMIASALRLGFPLPNKPASTEHAKDRMLNKLSKIRSDHLYSESIELTNEDYVLLYSYILVVTKISEELDNIVEEIKELLGLVNEEIFQLV